MRASTELADFVDAGTVFYSTYFWSLWDLGIIATGMAFFIVRMVAIANRDKQLTEIAFDILSVEALFLVPRCDLSDDTVFRCMLTGTDRICSLLSLHPYFGTLLPCLKEMVSGPYRIVLLNAPLNVGRVRTSSSS